MKTRVTISLYITWSKLVAFIMLILAFVLDFITDKKGTIFTFAIPFVVFLISGKQFFDKNKPEIKTDPE